MTALLLNVPLYGFLWWFSTYVHNIAFLNRMAITFGVILAVMLAITALRPLEKPRTMPVREDFDMPGTPIRLYMRDQGEKNPYKGKKKSTPSRLRKHIKGRNAEF